MVLPEIEGISESFWLSCYFTRGIHHSIRRGLDWQGLPYLERLEVSHL